VGDRRSHLNPKSFQRLGCRPDRSPASFEAALVPSRPLAGSGDARRPKVRELAPGSQDETRARAQGITAFTRHVRGDWGDVDDEDWEANERALMEGTRLLSVYRSAEGVKFWVITEWDRSLTTVLLPEEY
jgi:hypothetical protein